MTINSVLGTKCDQCKKVLPYKLITSATRFFVCSKCDKATNGVGELQQKVICDKVKTVKRFCYLGNRLNAIGRCEATVTAEIRVGWKKFREYEQYGEYGKILFADEKEGIQKLCKISNVILKQNRGV